MDCPRDPCTRRGDSDLAGAVPDAPDGADQNTESYGIDRRDVREVDNDGRPVWHLGKRVSNAPRSGRVEVAREIGTHSQNGDVG